MDKSLLRAAVVTLFLVVGTSVGVASAAAATSSSAGAAVVPDPIWDFAPSQASDPVSDPIWD
jgi:hypothetical protein